MHRARWAFALALLSAALVAAGQVSAKTHSTGTTMAGTIKIGISLPLTGRFSEPGTDAMKGYKLWASLLNKKGGLLGKKVVLDIKDDASDQATIVSDYNRLISEDHVDLLLGTFSSLLNLPASSVAEKNHMVFVAPAGGSPALFARHYHYYFFSQQATARYRSGLATFVDVADAQRILTQTEIDDSLAKLNVWRAMLSVSAAQGDLQPFLERTK